VKSIQLRTDPRLEKVRDRETRSPACEPRALPGTFDMSRTPKFPS